MKNTSARVPRVNDRVTADSTGSVSGRRRERRDAGTSRGRRDAAARARAARLARDV